MEEMSGRKVPPKLVNGVIPRPPYVELTHTTKVDWAPLSARRWARG